jgi:oligosaccharide repeat unit polymerase
MQITRRSLRQVLGIFYLSKFATDALAVGLLSLGAATALYALVAQDMYLCLESIFLAFIPYLIWSAYRRTGKIDVFAPDVGFPLTYIVYLYLGSINVPLQTQFGLTLPWVVWLYYIIGLVAYLFGVRLFGRYDSNLAAKIAPKLVWPSERFFLVTVILLLIGLGAHTIVILRSGIIFFHANDEAARTVGVGGVLGVLSLCSEAAVECFLLYLLVSRPKGPSRWFMIGSITLVLLIGLASTNRNGVLRSLLAAVVIVHYVARRFSLKSLVVIGILTGVFVAALGTFRDVSLWGAAREHSLEEQGFTPQTFWLFNGYEALRLPTETFYMTIQEVPTISPYTYGTTSLSALTAVLPGHRPAPSEIVKNTLRLQFVGFGAASTILGPLWFDGGVIGIIVGMFLFGLVSRFLYGRVLSSSNYVWILIYGWFVQNALKAVKDDILPELGVAFVVFLFAFVAVLASPKQQKLAKF